MQSTFIIRTISGAVGALALLLWAVLVPAQQTVEAGTTLHVYTSLLQIPVLVLSQKHEALPPIDPEKFLLKIGTEPPFRPRVRLEGEDPITLAVLIDGSPDGPKLPDLSEALAAMARDQMRPKDRIAFYGLDGCRLRRSLLLYPPDANVVRTAVNALLEHPPFQHRWRGEQCASPVQLWDSIAWVAQSLQGEPGRRVMLVISNGVDEGSRINPELVRRTAARYGVAVFSMGERFKIVRDGLTAYNVMLGGYVAGSLAYMSEGSGGMLMETTRNNVAGALARFPDLLRSRYILEFSRPPGISAGEHMLKVTVGQPKDFIRSAGTSMPVADPVAADPTVKHGASDPAKAALAIQADEPPVTTGPLSIRTTPAPSGAVPPAAVAPAPRITLVPAPTPPAVPVRAPAADPADVTDDVLSAAIP